MATSTEFEELLKSKQVTKADLARRLGVTAQYIGQIAKHKRKVAPAMVEQIELALHLAPGSLDGLLPTHEPQARRMPTLDRMEGIEVAYLETTMRALAAARRLTLRQTIGGALRRARGKSDTHFFDVAAEQALAEHIRKFDAKCAIFAEEGTVDERREWAERLCFFFDPFDRSKPFADALKAQEPRCTYVQEAITASDWPMHGLDAPFASVTCLKESQISFNVMLDYVSGNVYVACREMLKYADIARCPDPLALAEFGEDIRFNARDGTEFVAFLGYPNSSKRPQYEAHLAKLKFLQGKLPPPEYQVPGGPGRILYLSDSQDLLAGPLPALILSNGEKICEWLGWLAYACHSEQLRAFELYAQEFSARELVLLAPPPNYSCLSIDTNGCRINLDRITVLDAPVRYRAALVVTHIRSDEANIEMRGMAEGVRELPLCQQQGR